MSEVKSKKAAFKPTTTILYYLLGNLRTRWNAIGEELGVPHYALNAIRKNHSLCYRRMIEMLESWIMLDQDCTWSQVVRALEKIGEKEFAGKVEHYTKELERIEMSLPTDTCKRLVPMRQHSYDNWCLDMATCDMPRAEIESEQRLINCLVQAGAATKWYMIGICLKIPKWYLDTIEDDYTDTISKVRKMVIRLGKTQCKWQNLIRALADIDLKEAAKSVEELARKRGYTEIVFSFNVREFKKKDFISREHQLSLQDLREALHIHDDVSTDEIFWVLDQYYDRNPDDLKRIVHSVENVEVKCSKESKEIEEEVQELAEELEVIKMVCASLEKQNKDLERGKKLLLQENEMLRREARNTKILQPKLREKKEEIQEIDKTLKENSQDREKMNISNAIVCKKLKRCQEHQDKCRVILKRCQTYTTNKQENLKTDPNYRFITDDGKILVYTATGFVAGAAGGAVMGAVGGPVGVVVGGVLGGVIGAVHGYLFAGKSSQLRFAYESTFKFLDQLISENTIRVEETENRIRDIDQLLADAEDIRHS